MMYDTYPVALALQITIEAARTEEVSEHGCT
jgi:hypothetical protein